VARFVAGEDEAFGLWDAKSGVLLVTLPLGAGCYASSCAISHHGEIVIGGDGSKSACIRTWDIFLRWCLASTVSSFSSAEPDAASQSNLDLSYSVAQNL
jgi:hypothetical protein